MKGDGENIFSTFLRVEDGAGGRFCDFAARSPALRARGRADFCAARQGKEQRRAGKDWRTLFWAVLCHAGALCRPLSPSVALCRPLSPFVALWHTKGLFQTRKGCFRHERVVSDTTGLFQTEKGCFRHEMVVSDTKGLFQTRKVRGERVELKKQTPALTWNLGGRRAAVRVGKGGVSERGKKNVRN